MNTVLYADTRARGCGMRGPAAGCGARGGGSPAARKMTPQLKQPKTTESTYIWG